MPKNQQKRCYYLVIETSVPKIFNACSRKYFFLRMPHGLKNTTCVCNTASNAQKSANAMPLLDTENSFPLARNSNFLVRMLRNFGKAALVRNAARL